MNMQKLMKQMQQAQVKQGEMQDKLEALVVTGSAGGGMVTVTCNGTGKVSALKIDRVVVDPEDVEALDAIAAIAAIDGIDALFIGRIDLTIALGCDSPDDPRVIDAVERIVAACVAAARPVGMYVSRSADVPSWRAKGVSLFLLESDHVFLRSGAVALRRLTGL